MEQSVVSSEIEIETPDQYERFIEAEQEKIDQIIAKVKSSNADVVFSAEGIDSRVLHSLADSGIFALGGLEKTLQKMWQKPVGRNYVTTLTIFPQA